MGRRWCGFRSREKVTSRNVTNRARPKEPSIRKYWSVVPRPPGLDADQLRELLQTLEGGGTRQTAAAAAGLGYQQLMAWLHRGERGDAEYAALAQAVARVEAESQMRLVRLVGDTTLAILADPDSSDRRLESALGHVRWTLERRWPHTWDAVRAAKAEAAQQQAHAISAADEPSPEHLPVHEQIQILEAAAKRLRRDGARALPSPPAVLLEYPKDEGEP